LTSGPIEGKSFAGWRWTRVPDGRLTPAGGWSGRSRGCGLARSGAWPPGSVRRADHGSDNWERIVRIVAEHDSLPDAEVKVIEKAVAEAYRGWSDAQRRSIWYETDSGMTDCDDDDSLCDTSVNGIGYALEIEMLDEVTRAAWADAKELNKAAAKRHRQENATR